MATKFSIAGRFMGALRATRFFQFKVNKRFSTATVDRVSHADRPHDIGPFTNKICFDKPEDHEIIPTFRMLDNEGNLESSDTCEVDGDLAVKMYKTMVLLDCFDRRMTEAQQSGLISFYLTSHGEEACQVGSAAALLDQDLIFPQYREAGVVLWRGISLEHLIDTCLGNSEDTNKGRQMPIHYGSASHNYVTVSSTVGPQAIHAVGAAYAYKRQKNDACVAAYFGDGGLSTGDLHAALNFSATLETPLIFFCRNNQLAISTSITEGMRCDGATARARGYGLMNLRVDGNDALAVYTATQVARQITLRDMRPVCLEAMTYRVGHHSSNVDLEDYRDSITPKNWTKLNNPIYRLRRYLENYSGWNSYKDEELIGNIKNEVEEALQRSKNKVLPKLECMFTDVYKDTPPRLRRQMAEFRHHVTLYSEEYPLGDHEGL